MKANAGLYYTHGIFGKPDKPNKPPTQLAGVRQSEASYEVRGHRGSLELGREEAVVVLHALEIALGKGGSCNDRKQRN